ncbi:MULTISPECIES: enoyl-CoA hydratase-related protein [Mumia]|uniref:enoyl-CoA hydratase-related protein n=1 Tax=Mumia TaxID=1546255 RepID=UPI00141F82DE|nr:enoyl-CoA hydratase-related protein [Mumia sp. ZJ1417]QMW66179.1 enoyl-CoA hydratase/isomerase family protein [Mumia sp. ZJ1417]
MTELVRLEVADQVATITLDSQHNRNALSAQLVTELVGHLETAAADPDALVVVIAAAGPVFCSGADLSEAAGGGMVEGAKGLVALQRLIVTLPKPVVVRLHGPVRAGGLGIVGAADVVVCADDVTFAFTEVRLALAPAVISLTTLERMTPRAAARTFLTGAKFSAAQAVEYGLVTEAVAPDALDAALGEILDGLRKAYPQGLRETKALLNADLVARIDRLGDEVAEQSGRLFGSDEARTAMLAFLNRKKS